MATRNKKDKPVDTPVENQENPGTSEQARPSTEVEPKSDNPNQVPANDVDDTVRNQESPGVNMVDRNPGPQVVTDSAGIEYDVSKSAPELITEDSKREAERNRIRQQEGVFNTNDLRSDENVVEFVFLESGLTTSRSWKKGEILRVEEDKQEPWMKFSKQEQEDKYGRVMFERK